MGKKKKTAVAAGLAAAAAAAFGSAIYTAYRLPTTTASPLARPPPPLARPPDLPARPDPDFPDIRVASPVVRWEFPPNDDMAYTPADLAKDV